MMLPPIICIFVISAGKSSQLNMVIGIEYPERRGGADERLIFAGMFGFGSKSVSCHSCSSTFQFI